MAAGDFYIRRNGSDTSVVPNAGTNLDADWDTLEYDEGSICTYSDPNFQLDIGLYLIMYSEFFSTTNTTNNERIEIQGEIHVSGTGVVGGYGQDYIRKSSDDQEAVVQGAMYLQVTANNTDVFIRFYRTDNSTTGTVVRNIDKGGVIILEMDDTSHNFGFASASASEVTSAATERTLLLNTNDKMDTGFSLASNQITVTTAGRYLVHYEMDVSQTGTGREVVTAYLRKNGTTEIIGTRGYTYLRGADGTQDGAVNWIGIVDLAASDSIDVRWVCPTNATITCAAGTGILQMWQLPSGADECIMEATTGDYNTDGDFVWDTLPHIDTGSFTATAGTSNIDVDQSDHCLVFATFAQVTDSSVQRAVPQLTVKNNGSESYYYTGAAYHRNSSTSNFAVSVAGLATVVPKNKSLEIHTRPLAASGALANTKGQFSVLSLESIWSYSYPPAITNVGDDQIDVGETNNTILGDDFGATQGVGKVELCNNALYASATIKVTQTIVSWTGTTIVFDSVGGTLTEGFVWVFVTENGGEMSTGYMVNYGIKAYSVVILDESPHRYWTFQNTYIDEVAGTNANNAAGGTPAFVTNVVLCRGDTHSLEIATGDYTSPPDTAGINLLTAERRYMGGWIQLDSVQQILCVLYEEGAQVNNIAYLLGFGNILFVQVADTGDDYVQAYTDITLAVDRPYHIMFKFEASAYDAEVRMYLDGILQTRTNGNPWTASDLDAHSGNISWGHEGTEALQVGEGTDATDIVFASPNKCYNAHWINWVGESIDPTVIRDELFEKGALAYITISGDTQVNMQTQIDIYSGTTRPDYPIAIKVDQPNTFGNLELILDNITFETRCSVDIQWLGGVGDTLTLVLKNGSSVDTNKISLPYGGDVTLINAPALTIIVKDANDLSLVENARVFVTPANDDNFPYEDSVTITGSSTTATVTHTGHTLSSGDKVNILGATQQYYNGIFSITKIDNDSYSYTMAGTPSSPATGTITSTYVLIADITDSNGEIKILRTYTTDQEITGRVRRATTGKKYITAPITGDVDNNIGLEKTILLIPDE